MSQDLPIIRRMLGAAKTGLSEPNVSVQVGLQLAMTRALDQFLGQKLEVLETVQSTCTLAELSGHLAEQGAVFQLLREGRPVGLLQCDLAMTDAIISFLTTGQPSGNGGEARDITDTDRFITRPFAQSCIAALVQDLAKTPLHDVGAGISIGPPVVNLKDLPLIFKDTSFLAFQHLINLSQDSGEGKVCVVLPNIEPVIDAPNALKSSEDWEQNITYAVDHAPASLNVVLHRFPMTIGDIDNLTVGTVMPIFGVTAASVKLETAGGYHVANARLGQSTGLRAVRIEPTLPMHISELETPKSKIKDDQLLAAAI